MNISRTLQRVCGPAIRLWKKRGSTILTVGAVVGVGVTGYLAAQAGAKAEQHAQEAAQDHELTTSEYIKVTCKDYIPPVVSGTITAVMIVSAHVMDSRHAASLAAAYAILDKSFRDYREKTKEKLGEDAESEIREDIVKDRVLANRPEPPSGDKILIYDMWAERYYEKTPFELLNAEYHFNRNYQLRGYSPLNEFYDFLGEDHVKNGDDFGWSFDVGVELGYEWIDFSHQKVYMDDGLEVYNLWFTFEPHPIYAL